MWCAVLCPQTVERALHSLRHNPLKRLELETRCRAVARERAAHATDLEATALEREGGRFPVREAGGVEVRGRMRWGCSTVVWWGCSTHGVEL
jgi:hypothetical protein